MAWHASAWDKYNLASAMRPALRNWNRSFLWLLNVLIQKEIPQGAVGRVYEIYNSILNVLFVISPLLGGLLVSSYGPAFTFQIVGSLAIIVGGFGLLLRRRIWERKRAKDI